MMSRLQQTINALADEFAYGHLAAGMGAENFLGYVTDQVKQLKAIASSARALVERIREREGDVPDSALLTGAYRPELERLIEALKAWEEADRHDVD